MKTVAIVQARMGSTRLPGKVLMDVAGVPMLARVVTRLGQAKSLDGAIVATSTDVADDAIAGFCSERGWACFRGNLTDVLDRYYRAAQGVGADRIVRITADCPLIDPAVVDRVVAALAAADYSSNVVPVRTFPRGLDVEAFTFAALERVWRDDADPASREHVTPYICRHPETFRIIGVEHDVDQSHHRWTVDTAEDLDLVRCIYGHFGRDDSAWKDVLPLFDQHPEWVAINRHVEQKKV